MGKCRTIVGNKRVNDSMARSTEAPLGLLGVSWDEVEEEGEAVTAVSADTKVTAADVVGCCVQVGVQASCSWSAVAGGLMLLWDCKAVVADR